MNADGEDMVIEAPSLASEASRVFPGRQTSKLHQDIVVRPRIARRHELENFLTDFLALGSDAAMGGLATATIAYLLLGGRDMATIPMVSGSAVIAALVVSAILAIFGYVASNIPIAVAIATGIAAAYLMRPRT